MKSLAAKIVVLFGLLLVLLFAVTSVRGVLEDRLQYREEALASVGQSLAGAQRVAGVALVVPYVERWTEEQGSGAERRRVEQSHRHEHIVLPERLDANGRLAVDPRRRGLFRVNGYVYDGALTGELRMPAMDSLPRLRTGSTLEVGMPRLVLGVGDVRGLRAVAFAAGGRPLEVQPGTGVAGLAAGVSAPLGEPLPAAGARLEFTARLQLGGVGTFEIVPLGRESIAKLESPWPHPSFSGSFLPLERTVGDTGFRARWQTTAVASNARDAWLAIAQHTAAENAAAPDTFAVQLVEPVDIYALTDRSTKYALLFIALTLGVFALYEMLRRMHVHPLQYLFVGLALVTFFLLLLALAEHLGFALAYLAASSACVLLLGVYVGGVLRSRMRGATFGAGVAALYAALYGIVQSEQNALLLGALLVFGILAAVMIATRRVDWSELLDARRAGAA